MKIPKNYPVKQLKPGQAAQQRATCGTCGRSWDDAIVTSMTPAPAARCPFEAFHVEEILKTQLPKREVSVSGHTPTPWYRNIKANGKYPVIFAGRNNHVCVVSQQPTGEETEANIDFIVRAVNSHETLKELADIIVSRIGEAVDNDDEITGSDAVDLLANVLLPLARTAIAQAEGTI